MFFLVKDRLFFITSQQKEKLTSCNRISGVIGFRVLQTNRLAVFCVDHDHHDEQRVSIGQEFCSLEGRRISTSRRVLLRSNVVQPRQMKGYMHIMQHHQEQYPKGRERFSSQRLSDVQVKLQPKRIHLLEDEYGLSVKLCSGINVLLEYHMCVRIEEMIPLERVGLELPP